MTILDRLKAWLNPPPLESPESPTRREEREASRRWAAHNAAKKAAGCPCGKPATAVTYDHGNIGWVPVEFWTCDEHKGASG